MRVDRQIEDDVSLAGIPLHRAIDVQSCAARLRDRQRREGHLPLFRRPSQNDFSGPQSVHGEFQIHGCHRAIDGIVRRIDRDIESRRRTLLRKLDGSGQRQAAVSFAENCAIESQRAVWTVVMKIDVGAAEQNVVVFRPCSGDMRDNLRRFDGTLDGAADVAGTAEAEKRVGFLAGGVREVESDAVELREIVAVDLH